MSLSCALMLAVTAVVMTTTAGCSSRGGLGPCDGIDVTAGMAVTPRCIAAVLDDVLRREYRIDPETRAAAFSTLAAGGANDMLPRVRGIAAMVLPDGRRSYEEFSAVSDALDLLVSWNDEAAVSSNRARLNDRDLRGIATRNLAQLEAWEATGDVERQLLSMEMTIANGHHVVAMLEFLHASPLKSIAACDGAARARKEYELCDRRPEVSFCSRLLFAVTSIKPRPDACIVGERHVR